MNIKQEVEKANEWAIKWSRHFKSKLKQPLISVHCRQTFGGIWPNMAALHFRRPQVKNYCKPQFKIHLFPFYFDLPEYFQEEVIKHEICHYIDFIENGFDEVMRDIHGDRFKTYLEPINGHMKININEKKGFIPNLTLSNNVKHNGLNNTANKERSLCFLGNSAN